MQATKQKLQARLNKAAVRAPLVTALCGRYTQKKPQSNASARSQRSKAAHALQTLSDVLKAVFLDSLGGPHDIEPRLSESDIQKLQVQLPAAHCFDTLLLIRR
jgi:hypothetical protein